MLLSTYRLLSDEWKSYVEYAVKMATLIAVGVCLVFLFSSLLLLSVDEAPQPPDEAGAVRNEMRHAWQQYRAHSWGANELAPETLSPSRASDPLVGSRSGLTIVESLDTLHLMGMSKEFQQAEAWVATSFNFTNVSSSVSAADTSAKLLGGLLSAFSFTERPMFLYKALQVAEGLLAAFETPSGLPAPLVIPFDGPVTGAPARYIRLDQMTSLYLEFAFLHRLTGLQKYASVSEKILAPVTRHLWSRWNGSAAASDEDTRSAGGGGLWTPPELWDTWTGEPLLSADVNESSSALPPLRSLSGSLALAEVAIKAHLLVGDRDALRLFRALMRGRLNLDAWLGCRTAQRVGAECQFNLSSCRLVETLLLSLGQSRDPIAQRDLAHRLGELCNDATQLNTMHLAPDAMLLKSTRSGALVAKETDAHYAARPAPVLAGLLMWSRRRRTRHQQWLSSALRSIAQYLKSPSGYQGFTRATGSDQPRLDNRQPSYLLAQTFKYIYMAFEPNRLNLVNGDWIFNTAGHLLPVLNGQQFNRLRDTVRANFGHVRQLLGDMEVLRLARRRGQAVQRASRATAGKPCPLVMAAAAAAAALLLAAIGRCPIR